MSDRDVPSSFRVNVPAMVVSLCVQSPVTLRKPFNAGPHPRERGGVAFNGRAGESPQFVMANDTGRERERAERDAILVDKVGVRQTESYVAERYDLEPEDFTLADPGAKPLGSLPLGDGTPLPHAPPSASSPPCSNASKTPPPP